MNKWRGENDVVTSCSSGIGRAILKERVKQGVNVFGVARHVEKFQDVIEEMKGEEGKITIRQCDVSDSESVRNAFNWIEENLSAVDILVNC